MMKMLANEDNFITKYENERHIFNGNSYFASRVVGEFAIKLSSRQSIVSTNSVFLLTNGDELRYAQYPLSKGGGVWLYARRTPENEVQNYDDTLNVLNLIPEIYYAYPVYLSHYNGRKLYINDEIILRLKENHPFEEILDLMQRYDLACMGTLVMSTDIFKFRIKQPKTLNPFCLCEILNQHGSIEWAEPNFAQEIVPRTDPSDEGFPLQW